MKPRLGDWFHFRSVCATCNGNWGRHFTFEIDDQDLLSILPEPKGRWRVYTQGQEVNFWLDHSPSIAEEYRTKLISLIANVKNIFGRSETHGYVDTYLIILGDEHSFVTGPSRGIVLVTDQTLLNPRIANAVESMNLSHFNYVDLTTSPTAGDDRSGHSDMAPQTAQSVNEIITQKQWAVGTLLGAAITERRRKLGLTPLVNDSALGQAALPISQALMMDEDPQTDRLVADYRESARSYGYQGVEVSAAYYRKAWPFDASDEEIVEDILDIFSEKAMQEVWEDWGFGLGKGFNRETPKIFGMGVVFGVGYSDGNALITNYINQARLSVGAPPLELNYHLRRLAGLYLAMKCEPEPDQIWENLNECGYMAPGFTVRQFYSGVYAPIPSDQGGLSIRDVARLVADELIMVHGERLLRPDWQDFGIAVRLDPVTSPIGQEVPSITAEYLLAWRLPEDADRPEHFPPPADPTPSV